MWILLHGVGEPSPSQGIGNILRGCRNADSAVRMGSVAEAGSTPWNHIVIQLELIKMCGTCCCASFRGKPQVFFSLAELDR